MKASLRLNNDLPAGRLVEIALLAEADGFDAIWVSHDLFLRSAPVLLAVLARETTRIGIGSCVFNPYSAHPAELAMTAATLQEVSGGRFRLGLAAGDATFLGWAGIRRPRPLARTREALLAVRALLEGGRPAESDGAGPGWRPEGWLRGGPAPTPIHLGAMSPRMLELADGALALLFPPEHYPVAAGHVRAGLARAAATRPRSTCPPACGARSTSTTSAPASPWPPSSPTTGRRSRPGCWRGPACARTTSRRSARPSPPAAWTPPPGW